MSKFKPGDKVCSEGWEGVFACVHPCNPEWGIICVPDTDALKSFRLHHIFPRKEPLSIGGWVNLYIQPDYCRADFFLDKHRAEQNRGDDLTACVYVSGTEGEEP